jgi:hypothetical protein
MDHERQCPIISLKSLIFSISDSYPTIRKAEKCLLVLALNSSLTSDELAIDFSKALIHMLLVTSVSCTI